MLDSQRHGNLPLGGRRALGSPRPHMPASTDQYHRRWRGPALDRSCPAIATLRPRSPAPVTTLETPCLDCQGWPIPDDGGYLPLAAAWTMATDPSTGTLPSPYWRKTFYRQHTSERGTVSRPRTAGLPAHGRSICSAEHLTPQPRPSWCKAHTMVHRYEPTISFHGPQPRAPARAQQRTLNTSATARLARSERLTAGANKELLGQN